MKELIARTQKEWEKLRRRLTRVEKPLPRQLPPGHLAAAIIPPAGEAAEITGYCHLKDNPRDAGHLIIEWQKTAGRENTPDVAFIRHKNAHARMLKVFNPSING